MTYEEGNMEADRDIYDSLDWHINHDIKFANELSKYARQTVPDNEILRLSFKQLVWDMENLKDILSYLDVYSPRWCE